MNLVDQIRKDVQNITTGDFSTVLTFITSTGAFICKGVAVNHNLTIDEMGEQVTGKTIRVTVSEQALLDNGYSIRNTDNNVNLLNQKIRWTDSKGITVTYWIDVQFPNERTGLIRLQMGATA